LSKRSRVGQTKGAEQQVEQEERSNRLNKRSRIGQARGVEQQVEQEEQKVEQEEWSSKKE
jgi:hypothetical protein